MPTHTQGVEQKTYRLTQFQTWVALIGFMAAGGLTWASGILSIPDKINTIQQQQTDLHAKQAELQAAQQKQEADGAVMPLRMKAVEDQQAKIWAKLSDDHDLLIEISSGMKDIKEQNADTRSEVKSIRDRPHN